jgi:dihydroorotate dehydrogenase
MRAMRESILPVYPLHYPLGVNLGKNKFTPNDRATEDYLTLIPELDAVADYFVINLSSPNTPGLRDLENPESIRDLFTQASSATNTPVFLKVSPDSEPSYTVDLCATAVDAGAQGIIATNTSIDYSLTPKAKDFGGLSGALIKEKSFTVFDAIAEELFGKALLISVGGIDSGEEAYRRVKAGASLVQVYSALIYEGPTLIRRMNRELLDCLERSGYNHISEAVGANRKRKD